MLNRKKFFPLGLLITIGTCVISSAVAGVSPEEAAHLGKDLTVLGAEPAGNADGTIPAWDGGITASSLGLTYKDGDFYQDPFAEDKILFTITAQNMAQYADKLNEGQKAMLKKYQDTYKINVYPTRRSQSAPQWFYDNTLKNATRGKITEDGLGIFGGYGGVPFPIPKRAEEVIFNHLVRWQGGSRYGEYVGGSMPPTGGFVEGAGGDFIEVYPYNFKSGSPENNIGGVYYIFINYKKPTRRKGELMVLKDPVDQSNDKRKAWQYLPGQRRVRRAPTIGHDTPNPSFSGLATYDDSFIFNGGLERFDWKLIGKKEMYIPYNNYQADLASRDELVTPYHLNPDLIRTELHRVWVVEATLKEGQRHTYGKRVYYIDEDSWMMVLSDNYDTRGNLWRTQAATSYNHYGLPGVIQRIMIAYDLQSETYALNALLNGLEPYTLTDDLDVPLKTFTAEHLRRMGRR